MSCILTWSNIFASHLEHVVAMAYVHDILLLWINISRLRVSSFLLVSSTVDFQGVERLTFLDPSMRYSRMLEESSFANRKADYFWLLLLSSVMLLVSYINSLSSASHASWNRSCHPYLISPFSPPHLPSSPYICGRVGIHLRQYRYSACSRSQHPTCPWPS